MHIVKLLERRFPKRKRSFTALLVLLSISLLLLGVAMMIVLM